MGRGDNRRTPKMLKKRAWRKKKARLKTKMTAKSAAE